MQPGKSINAGTVRILSWVCLFFNVVVILFGTVVRASGSGAGCGDHWPLCGDHLIPTFQTIAKVIEFTHRCSTGVDVLFVILLFITTFIVFPSGHLARKGASLVLLFTLSEAVVGAMLVLFKIVDQNTSVFRIVMEGFHLTNTLLLLASIILTALASEGMTIGDAASVPRRTTRQLVIAILGTLLLTVSGGIAGLADSIYHTRSLKAGLRADFLPSSPLMIHLRVLHPVIATIMVTYLLFIAWQIMKTDSQQPVKYWCRNIMVLCVVQYFTGILNLVILSPIWMQITHLLLADLLWISLVFLTFIVYGKEAVSQEYVKFKPGSGKSTDTRELA